MSSELDLFELFLRRLSQHARRPGTYAESEARDVYGIISGYYPPFGRPEEVAPFIPSRQKPKTNFADTNRFLYLAPSKGPPVFLPVMSVLCDFEGSIPEVRIKVGLFLLEAGGLRCIWLRFESPEGEGPHHYYHAQFIRDSSSPVPLGKHLSYLPDSFPSIALDAKGPVTLLLMLVVSLYGLEEATKETTDLAGLEEYWKELRCTGFTPTYWLVRAGGIEHKHRTFMADDRFRLMARTKHGRQAQILRSDRLTYDANDGRPKETV